MNGFTCASEIVIAQLEKEFESADHEEYAKVGENRDAGGEVMKIYDNYFDVCRHIERDDPEAFTWKGIESTGLAEVMEEAEKHGYTYKLNCYDEVLEFHTLPGRDKVEHHVRSMIFCKAESEETE